MSPIAPAASNPDAPRVAVPSAVSPGAGRLVSLDTFRGFTMCWIVGGKSVFLALGALQGYAIIRLITYQITHTPWEGLRFYDLIWPSFMLMVGVAIPFSFAKRAQTQTHAQIIATAARRSIVLFLLGSLRTSLSNHEPTLIELSSALQPIALAYFVASLLAGARIRTQAAFAAAILTGYGLLLAFVPGGGFPAGSYAKNANLVTAVDLAVLGRTLPEGWGTLLSAIPTISTTLIGLILGEVLRSDRSQSRKVAIIAGTGGLCLALGYALSPVVPIIMKLWSASYGLASAGWACLMFAAFYWIIDVRQWRWWTFPFLVFGMNAIAIYLGVSIVPFSTIVGTFSRPIAAHLGIWGSGFSALATLAVEWLVLWWMYRRRIFLKA